MDRFSVLEPRNRQGCSDAVGLATGASFRSAMSHSAARLPFIPSRLHVFRVRNDSFGHRKHLFFISQPATSANHEQPRLIDMSKSLFSSRNGNETPLISVQDTKRRQKRGKSISGGFSRGVMGESSTKQNLVRHGQCI